MGEVTDLYFENRHWVPRPWNSSNAKWRKTRAVPRTLGKPSTRTRSLARARRNYIWLTDWLTIFLEKLIVPPLVTKFSFYRIRIIIAVLTRSCHVFLIWSRQIQSTSSHPIFKCFFLIFSYHLRPGLPNFSFFVLLYQNLWGKPIVRRNFELEICC
jgi:hypothetical protein